MTFGRKLKAARMQAGLSQEKLATELGISKRTVINYENGANLPTSDKLPLIAKYFGVSIEELISEQQEFVAAAYEKGGSRSARQAAALVDEVSGLFAGGKLSDEEKDTVMRAIQNAYWIAKEEGKRKFTPKKHRA
jgi:transcriptional regulator with XRE-family HTH domain